MAKDIQITLVAAMAENRCIGMNNQMPWHIPEDFKHFKAKTLGKPCIMGRKTFESILESLGKPLPGRTSIIITRNGYKHEEAITAISLEGAIETAKEIATSDNQNEICIIGGGQIFEQALPLSNKLELTYVHRTVEGDAFFPAFIETDWSETAREDHDGFSFVTYQKANAGL